MSTRNASFPFVINVFFFYVAKECGMRFIDVTQIGEAGNYTPCTRLLFEAMAPMIGEKIGSSVMSFTWEKEGLNPSPTGLFPGRQDQSFDAMQLNAARSSGSKRKMSCDIITPPSSKQRGSAPTGGMKEDVAIMAKSGSRGTDGANDALTDTGRKRDDRLNISCLQGSTMRIPLGGKTIHFRVSKRRGSGISSVVFECDRVGDGLDCVDEDGCPNVVTVKVLCGGEAGMGTCLREVETLAFLKVKREEAGLADARFAELVSWFYRRSAIGGVDHVCLVFRGGGISLWEAMQERASAGAKGSAWKPGDIVAVARGLLEGLAFLHDVGLIHADLKPENVALYPPAAAPGSNAPGSTSVSPESATAAAPAAGPGAMTPCTVGSTASQSLPSGAVSAPTPFDLRLIDLGNAVFAADAVPGVTAGTPSYLSPEARDGRPWGPGVDVWATGCILYEIVTKGRVDSGDGLVDRGLNGWAAGAAGSLDGCRLVGGLLKLVERLLEVDPAKRPTAQDALRDPVFQMT